MSRICRKEEKKIPSKEKKEAKVEKDPDGWFLQKKGSIGFSVRDLFGGFIRDLHLGD